MKEGCVVANGIEFAFLEEGSGPLLLLLHGYPDIAWTWEHQMAPFAAAGYRVVAPFLRGHPWSWRFRMPVRFRKAFWLAGG